MLLGETTDAIITAAPIFRVNSRSVILKSKCLDSGVRVKLHTSHPALMYYFIRFTDIGTRHSFAGSLNVSAYTFDDSTKAFANIRLSLTAVRPVFQVDDDGMVISTFARRIKVKGFPRTSQFLKMKCLNVEAFALQLSDMYEDLVSRRLIVPNYNPVFVEERISRPQNDPNTNRPVPCVMRTVYSYNVNVKRLEVPFNPSVIINNDSSDDNADTASQYSSTMSDE
ncbi:hypothetical protein G6F43_007439 [Rhizopus delemar]|nr:hypothetical protein G6F43_007439 [Rhizopus delemar]